MTEYQLEEYCKRHSHCDCVCMNCKGFAAYQRHELGLDEYDEDIED